MYAGRTTLDEFTGVIGLDLSISCIGGMPRTLGWPRKKSEQTIKANNTELTYADFLNGTANTVAPQGGSVKVLVG